MDTSAEPVSPSHEALELQAYRAIGGGEYVRSRILHTLSLGNPSVESTAYLIKSRVKRADSLVLKVLDRQKREPTYDPFKARDIVGLRLLTLFRNELPVLVRRFLESINLSQRGSAEVFVGNALRETISEIRIYGLDPIVDPNMDLCIREFLDYGFSLATEYPSHPEDLPAKIVVDRKPSQYSSIHIVLWARGPSGYETDVVPVEVQLRTSLEDVWGEIDHRAVYKAKQLQKSQRTDHDQAGLARRIKNLKGILDACSSVADDIELDLSDGEVGDIVSSYKSYTSVDLSELRGLSLPPKETAICAEAASALDGFYTLVRQHNSGESISKIKTWFALLAKGTCLIEDFITSVLGNRNGSSDGTEFHLRMELALSYYWQAVLLKQYPHPPEPQRGLADGWHQAIRRSTAIYATLLSCNRYGDRAALSFRLGNALVFQGSHETAILHYKTAYDLLPLDTSIESNNYLRLRIPRQYGFAIWYEGSRLEQEALDLGSRGLYYARERLYYLDATRITLPIFGLEFTGGEFGVNSRSSQEEARVTANNVLYYAVCYLEVGGTQEGLEEIGLDAPAFENLMNTLSGGDLSTLSPITLADTARKVFLFREKVDEALRCAKRVLDLGTTRDLSVPLSEFHYRKMLREAQDTLDRFGTM